MRSFWFGNELPAEFGHPIVKRHLSFDGQLHFRCGSCDEVIWADVTFGRSLLESKQAFSCPNCRKGLLEVIKFLATESRLCTSCAMECILDSGCDFECPRCHNHESSLIKTLIKPSFPSRMYVFLEANTPLGVSPKHDTEFFIEYVRGLRMSPQFHRNCIHLIAFIEALFKYIYHGAPEAAELLNVASSLMRTVYKETGNIDAAFLAIAIMIEGRDLSTEPIQRAVFGVNICQNVYSALSRKDHEILSIRFGFDLKEYGISIGKQVLAELEDLAAQEFLAPLRARQKWLLGDILKSVNPSEEQITEALDYLNHALEDPSLPPECSDYVRESALTARAKSRSRTSATFRTAEGSLPERLHRWFRRNLNPSSTSGPDSSKSRRELKSELQKISVDHLSATTGLQRIMTLSELLRDNYLSDKSMRRREFELQCLGEALIYTANNDPKQMLRHAGTMISTLAAAFAAGRFANGEPLEGIAGVEAFRSLAIDHANVVKALGYHVHPLESRLRTAAALGPSSEDPKAIAAALLKQHRESFEEEFRDILGSDLGRFLVWYQAWNGRLLAAKIRLRNGKVVTQMAVAHIEKDSFLSLPMGDSSPGALRAEQVRRALRSGWRHFAELLQGEAVSNASVLIGSSILGAWPLDAAEVLYSGSERLKEMRPMTFAPTVRVACAVRRKAKTGRIDKVLLVPYVGLDLPGIMREIQVIKNAYGPRITVVDVEKGGKKEVLRQLSEPYDVIHFCGHGDFDYLVPMESKIYFHNKRGLEGAITANEILDCGNIGSSPIVVLSACSSALVLPNGANNFLGLAGALLRTGAVSIVGARWPILDSTGAEFSSHFHAKLASGHSVEKSLASTKGLLMNKNLDEWSAFMAIGA